MDNCHLYIVVDACVYLSGTWREWPQIDDCVTSLLLKEIQRRENTGNVNCIHYLLPHSVSHYIVLAHPIHGIWKLQTKT